VIDVIEVLTERLTIMLDSLGLTSSDEDVVLIGSIVEGERDL